VRSRASILDAASTLLAERGYSGFSVDAVAARSGVAKTTIYRHWPTRAHLLAAAAGCLAVEAPAPDTGSLRGDLHAFFAPAPQGSEEDRWSRSLLTIAEASESDPTVAQLRSELVAQKLAKLKILLDRGRARGELRTDLDTQDVMSLLVGPLLFRRLVLAKPPTSGDVIRIIDAILDGTAAQGSRPSNVRQKPQRRRKS
jgi:AcrR family transcriptional regulator